MFTYEINNRLPFLIQQWPELLSKITFSVFSSLQIIMNFYTRNTNSRIHTGPTALNYLIISIFIIINQILCRPHNHHQINYSQPVQIAIDRQESTESSSIHIENKPVQFYVQDPVEGTYHFGYDIGHSYREEKRESSGLVIGKYGFRDPEGIMHRFAYEADANGYRLREITLLPAVSSTTRKTSTSSTTTATTMSPFKWKFKDLQLIGPIPKVFDELFN